MKSAYVTALSMALLLNGCVAAEQKPTLMQPVAQPVAFQEPAPTYSNPGSIFDDNNAQYLFADSRARRVGDIVLVNVVENVTASNTANTNTKRTSSSDFSVDGLFGKSTLPLLGGTIGGATPLIGTTSDNEFKGEGTTTRKNNVTATVAARVLNIMPDGLMQIEGARETKINNETQYLVVSGLIRSRDVASDNSIMSTQMADAQIQYFGKGVLSDKQRPGWLTRLMDNVWPF